MKRLRVGVVYGGRSSEHEVSLASAAAVLTQLDPKQYEVIPICIQQDGRWSLADKPPSTLSAADLIASANSSVPSSNQPGTSREVHFLAYPAESRIMTIQIDSELTHEGVRAFVSRLGVDVVFPVVHGPFGEDGTLQGLFELANVPYVGTGVLGSAVAMDKAVAKTLFAANNLPTVKHLLVTAVQWNTGRNTVLEKISDLLTYPMFVKPANMGSSIGISKAADRPQLEQAIEVARQFDFKVIVEEAVPDAREIECAVLGNEAPEVSVPGEVLPSGEFYDYESKYVDDRTAYVIPAKLTSKQTNTLQSMAIAAFQAVEASGMARVDFLMTRETERLYLNEVNTIPGFTTVSMYAKLWQASGLGYPELLKRLINLALERHRERQVLRTSLT